MQRHRPHPIGAMSPLIRASVAVLALRAATALALALAIAMLAPSEAPAASRAAATPASAVPPRIYNVTVTAQTKTTWVDGGCDPYCVRYNGTVKRTESYRGVRITSSEFRGIVQLQGSQTGTFTTQWTHASDPPACSETLTQRGKARINVYGRYGVKGTQLPPLMSLGVGPAGPPEGPTITCATNTNPVPVVGRLATSLVGGTLTESSVTLNGFRVGRTANGRPGAPLDQISRGVGFVISLRGTTKDTTSMKSDLAAGKQATYTEGSVRIVFTPVVRRAQRALSSHGGRVNAATVTANRAACAKTYPDWWSTRKRACFLVTVSARWQVTKTWKQDLNGAPCVGSEGTTMSWRSRPSSFWVGDTFPAGYTGASRARTADFVQGPIEATVIVRASGGAYEYACTPLLSKDCGERRVRFADAFPTYTVLMQDPVSLVVSFGAYASPPSPFRSCGTVGTVELGPSPDFGAWVVERRAWSRGISGQLDDLAERHLLATPVGGRLSFRASGHPAGSGTYQTVTGSLTGAVTFERVR